jgi:glycosyltransferase involved in cell wall biosynthesis
LNKDVVLVSPVPFGRQTHQFSRSDEFGVRVAQDDLYLAALRHTAASLAFLDVKLDGPLSLSGLTASETRGNPSALISEFGPDRVWQGTFRSLPADLRGKHPVYISGGGELSKASLLRDSLPPEARFPILNVLHSSYWPAMMQSYVSLLLGSKPYDRFVATSRAGLELVRRMTYTAAEYLERSGLVRLQGDPEAQLRTALLPLGVHMEPFQQVTRDEARKTLQIPNNATVLLYLGRFSEEYKADLEPLVRAFAEARRNHPELLLLLAGQDKEGAYSETVKKCAARLGLGGDSLMVLTNFPYFLKPQIYGAADIFASPVDNLQETFGLSIVEAMAAGLPIVASDWSGYRDLVKDGETGILVPATWDTSAAARANRVEPYLEVYDMAHFLAQRTVVDVGALTRAIESLASQPGLRQQMGEAGRKRAESEYSWKALASRYESLWQQQLSEFDESRLQQHPARVWVDMNHLYSHMATSAAVASSAKVFCSEPDHSLREIESHASSFGSTALRSEVRRLARLLGPFPVDMAQFQRPAEADAVGWLWKRGLCQIVQTKAAAAASAND